MNKAIIVNDIVLRYLDAMQNSNSLAELDHHDSNLCAAVMALRKVGIISLEALKDYDKISTEVYIATSKALKAQAV